MAVQIMSASQVWIPLRLILFCECRRPFPDARGSVSYCKGGGHLRAATCGEVSAQARESGHVKASALAKSEPGV